MKALVLRLTGPDIANGVPGDPGGCMWALSGRRGNPGTTHWKVGRRTIGVSFPKEGVRRIWATPLKCLKGASGLLTLDATKTGKATRENIEPTTVTLPFDQAKVLPIARQTTDQAIRQKHYRKTLEENPSAPKRTYSSRRRFA